MNNFINIFITVHHISEDDRILSSYQSEEEITSREVVSKTHPYNANIHSQQQCTIPTDKENLNYHYLGPDEPLLRVFKYDASEEINPFNYATQISTILNVPEECKPYITNSLGKSSPTKRESKIPNVPIMVRCQNCDTNFPTKYQYQRHQCEFNAEKVVLKPNADLKDVDKGMRIKYDCETCGKQFVSKNNLERHQTSHDNTQDNICEHCNKQFVSENRLRIHKENHCKKAGDISKFYRSDVTVWKCVKCNQVFATPNSANHHAELCTDIVNNDIKEVSATRNNMLTNFKEEVINLPLQPLEVVNVDNVNNSNVEKILTELLLQCEFCNRTYSHKNLLMAHQRTHPTNVNYECIMCKETFESYTSATKHWMTKCSDEANLFYLPKMTYCEYCDRTFKSHEILYTHKIKKKHYTPKLHLQRDNICRLTSEGSKDVLVKLIQDVLTTMDINLNKEGSPDENCAQDKENKSEENFESASQEDNNNDTSGNLEPERKKRGRKRKWPKQLPKGRQLCSKVDEGFKYQCERCIAVFDNICDLETHRDNEHASNFSCDECGQVVHSAKALIIHNRAHQSLKPYVCEQCGRSYSQTSHLWQHMRFHQGIKPFACPHEGCEARYTIRPDLKDHIRKVHTRERPFKCGVCNKCFLTGSVYYQHRLIHTNDRRYGCDICEKRFFRADALNNHRRIHTDERPYPCEICGREFRQKGDRNKHVRTQHPE